MNAVRLFRSKLIGVKSISPDGTITLETDKLTDEDMIELSHLRVDISNGRVFDERYHSIIGGTYK